MITDERRWPVPAQVKAEELVVMLESEEASALAQLVRSGQVRALSIRQPWVHHILHNGKDVENRTWRSSYRGWLLLHAAKQSSAGAESEMPRGGIVGLAELEACVSQSTSPWFCGPYGFQLGRRFEIPLVGCRGLPSLFRPSEDVLDRVAKEVLAAARPHG